MVLQVATLKDLAGSLSSAIKQIIVDVIEFLTPIITIVAAGMIIIGTILIALRQEFYAIRLIVSGAIALIIIYLIIPVILGLLP